VIQKTAGRKCPGFSVEAGFGREREFSLKHPGVLVDIDLKELLHCLLANVTSLIWKFLGMFSEAINWGAMQ